MTIATRHIVLSAAFGDAVRSRFTLLSGRDSVHIVNVFTGLPPRGTPAGYWDLLTGTSDVRARMEERAREDREALALTATPATNLDFLPYAYSHRPADGRELHAAVDRLLYEVSHVWVPAGLGPPDPDRIALRELGASLHGVDVGVYADIPFATEAGWPAWVTGQPRDPYLDIDAVWRASLSASRLPFHDVQPVAVPVADAWAPKARACLCYASQRPALERGPFQALTHPSILGWEVYWPFGRL